MMEIELTPEQEQQIHDEYGEPADLLGRDAPYYHIAAQVILSLEDRATLQTAMLEGQEVIVLSQMVDSLLNEGITPTEMKKALQIARNLDQIQDHLDAIRDQR
jgi:hypothetical protein